MSDDARSNPSCVSLFVTLKLRVTAVVLHDTTAPNQKSRPITRTQVAQLHTRNYAVRFGLEVEANAE